MAGFFSARKWSYLAVTFAVAAALAGSFWAQGVRAQSAPPPVNIMFADGSVRLLSAGLIALGPGENIHNGLLLPAVLNANVRVLILDMEGKILHQQDYRFADPTNPRIPYRDICFELSVSKENEIIYADGSVRTLIGKLSTGAPEDFSIMVRALLPAVQSVPMLLSRMHAASAQVYGADGSVRFILPYIEQDNLYKVLP